MSCCKSFVFVIDPPPVPHDLAPGFFSVRPVRQVDGFLRKCDSIPAFLSSLTIELFENQTFVPR